MEFPIKLLQTWLVEHGNNLTYSQLQRAERLIRDLQNLDYDVRKANDYLHTTGKEGSCTVCEMSRLSSKSEE